MQKKFDPPANPTTFSVEKAPGESSIWPLTLILCSNPLIPVEKSKTMASAPMGSYLEQHEPQTRASGANEDK